MKLFFVFLATAILAVSLLLYVYLALPPASLRSVTIPAAFIDHLSAKQSVHRFSDPLEVSLHLLYWGGASDPIDTTGMSIHVHKERDGTRTVEIDERYVQDDSTSRVFSRIHLRQEGSIWIPFERKTAQQGRGVFGWTTGPTK